MRDCAFPQDSFMSSMSMSYYPAASDYGYGSSTTGWSDQGYQQQQQVSTFTTMMDMQPQYELGYATGRQRGSSQRALSTTASIAQTHHTSPGIASTSQDSMTRVFQIELREKTEKDRDEMEHDARKKHPCSICGSRFDRPSSLKKHMSTHTGKKEFKCESCGRLFNVKSNLSRHGPVCRGDPTLNNTSHRSRAQSKGLSTDLPSAMKVSKRNRRTSVPRERWIPESLRGFNFDGPVCYVTVHLPALPVVPNKEIGEERNSFDTSFGSTPYSSKEWARKPILCGPAAVSVGFGMETFKREGVWSAAEVDIEGFEILGSRNNRRGIVVGKVDMQVTK